MQRTNVEVINLESNTGIGFKTANLCLQVIQSAQNKESDRVSLKEIGLDYTKCSEQIKRKLRTALNNHQSMGDGLISRVQKKKRREASMEVRPKSRPLQGLNQSLV